MFGLKKRNKVAPEEIRPTAQPVKPFSVEDNYEKYQSLRKTANEKVEKQDAVYETDCFGWDDIKSSSGSNGMLNVLDFLS